MAITTSDILYYNKNILRALPYWNLLNNATVSGNFINISSGGSAGVDLSNDYFNGLLACKYRRVYMRIAVTLSRNNDYRNYVEMVLRGVYTDNEGNQQILYTSVNVTLQGSGYSNSLVDVTRVIEMENLNLESCTVYVINHTTSSIQLQTCTMLRSQDISESQVGESIGWGITLSQVVGYLDGCEIYYDGVEEPDKLWWMEDSAGNFSGINVNNERMIKFSKVNEILLD